MSTHERKLLAKMTDLEEISRVWDMGLRRPAFEDPINGYMFEFMVNHWQNTQQQHAPTRLMMEAEYPRVQLEYQAEETTDWLVEWMNKRYVQRQLQQIVRTSMKTCADDPLGAIRTMWREARELAETGGAERTDFDTEYLQADQLDDLPPPEPMIKGVLQRHAYTVLRGRDGSFKSFIALDWSLCLATGTPWQEKEAERVKVLYVAGEGAHGIGERKRAWETRYGLSVEPDWFVVRRSAVNLFRSGSDYEHLLDYVEDNKFGLVVFDTLRRMSGGAEGNGSDMGVVVDNLEEVKRRTADGSVLVIAHTDKSDRDTRGFSGIEDDSDTVWSVKREGNTNEVVLTCTKMKDGPDGHRFDLLMRPQNDSLIVDSSTPSNAGQGHLLNVDRHTDQRIMAEMRETFAETGATVSDLVLMTGLSKATVYRSRTRLLETRQLRTSGSRLFLNAMEGLDDA